MLPHTNSDPFSRGQGEEASGDGEKAAAAVARGHHTIRLSVRSVPPNPHLLQLITFAPGGIEPLEAAVQHGNDILVRSIEPFRGQHVPLPAFNDNLDKVVLCNFTT
jgi:hypothetical protein